MYVKLLNAKFRYPVGEDRKRQPVISKAGKMCVAMETFLGDMASKPVPLQKNGHNPSRDISRDAPKPPIIMNPTRPFPPPKPKRTSPTATANISKSKFISCITCFNYHIF